MASWNCRERPYTLTCSWKLSRKYQCIARTSSLCKAQQCGTPHVALTRLSVSELVMGFVLAVITPSYATVVTRIAKGSDALVLLHYPHMWIQDGRQYCPVLHRSWLNFIKPISAGIAVCAAGAKRKHNHTLFKEPWRALRRPLTDRRSLKTGPYTGIGR